MAHQLSREEMIAKIKGCLALGTKGANTTEHEMATALAMAKKLMAKFNLTEAEVLEASVSKEAMEMADSVAPTRQNPHKYEQFLALVVECLFSVKPVLHGSGKYDAKRGRYVKSTVIKFYGTKTDVMLAASAYEFLRNTINDMALNCGYKLIERDQWRVGVVATMVKRVRDAADELAAAEAAKCRGLVVVKNAAIDEYIAKTVGKIGKGRASKGPRATPAYMQGRKDGERVDLNFKSEATQEPNKLLPS